MRKIYTLLTEEASRDLRQLTKDLRMGPGEVLEELLDMPFGLLPGRKTRDPLGGRYTLYPYKSVKHEISLVNYRYFELEARARAANLSKSDYCMLLIKMLGPLALRRRK